MEPTTVCSHPDGTYHFVKSDALNIEGLTQEGWEQILRAHDLYCSHCGELLTLTKNAGRVEIDPCICTEPIHCHECSAMLGESHNLDCKEQICPFCGDPMRWCVCLDIIHDKVGLWLDPPTWDELLEHKGRIPFGEEDNVIPSDPVEYYKEWLGTQVPKD